MAATGPCHISARQWREIVDTSFAFFGAFARDGRTLRFNRAALRAAGLTHAQIVGKLFWETPLWEHSITEKERVRDVLERAAQGETVRQEFHVKLAGGVLAHVDGTFSPFHDRHGNIAGVAGSGVDVSARHSVEDALRKINRELHMLSECNEALVRATDEHELLARICRIVVEVGGYRLAWVGIAEHDADRTVRPVAYAGTDKEYLEAVKISWGDGPNGHGPTGRAIRSGVPIVLRNLSCGDYTPWHAAAQRHGYKSSIALPVQLGADGTAALNIYSTDSAAFDAREMLLLSDLSGNLAYGLTTLRTRAHHARAMEQVQLFRNLLDRTTDIFCIADATTGAILDANEAVGAQLGYSREEILASSVFDLSRNSEDLFSWSEHVQQARDSGPQVVEATLCRRDGSVYPVEISLSFVDREPAAVVVVVIRDASERKRQERHISHLTRVLQMQSGINSAVLHIANRDELLREACRVAVDMGAYDCAVISVVQPDGRSAKPLYFTGTHSHAAPESFAIGDGKEPDESATGRALRTRKMVVCSDLTLSELPVLWRTKLLEDGIHSIVALPLLVEGMPVAGLTLMSRDHNLLRDEELVLLQDIASTLSFGLRSQQQAHAAEFLTYYDALTGLAKRPLFCEWLDALLRDTTEPHAPAVVAFDLHHLSGINDNFGRNFGDMLLQRVAERLKSSADSVHHVGYLGGGTFVLAQRGLATADESISSLLDSTVFGEPFSIEGRSVRVTCRAGVAHYSGDPDHATALVEKAEAALRHAKQTGEDYAHFRMQMHSAVGAKLTLENRLRAAIDAHQFVLHYQPQVSLATGRIEAVEALLRWNDPTEGLVPPARFLPVLESSGLIGAVGLWVLRQAARDCRRWRALRLGPVRVAVNVSPLQIQRQTFVQEVLEAATALCTEGYGIDIEITETSLLHDVERTSRKLRELRDAGIRIAIDDFGTGYSSLSLLSQLPIDILKIDRSFVRGLPDNAASVTLATSIVNLAAAFHLTTVAEGVETPEQLAMLRRLRCDQSQGYLHSKPVPIAELEKMLRESSARPG